MWMRQTPALRMEARKQHSGTGVREYASAECDRESAGSSKSRGSRGAEGVNEARSKGQNSAKKGAAPPRPLPCCQTSFQIKRQLDRPAGRLGVCSIVRCFKRCTAGIM
jgi:hypothetical protein